MRRWTPLIGEIAGLLIWLSFGAQTEIKQGDSYALVGLIGLGVAIIISALWGKGVFGSS